MGSWRKSDMEVIHHHHHHHLFLYVLLFVIYFFSCTESLSRRDFPAGFIFGGASSAYQYEGAAFQHGRGPSIWDTFTREHPEKIADHTTGDIADDFYYRFKESQMGEIGITVQSYWDLPKYQTVASIKAAFRGLDFRFGWFVNPIIFGDYPETMRVLVGTRLPIFTKSQSKMLKGSLDFLGVNYYTARYADDFTSSNSVNLSYTTDCHVNLTTEKDGIPVGQPTAAEWLFVYPSGIRELMLYVKKKYNNPPIYITENGVDDSGSLPIQKALNDSSRIKYYHSHLSNLLKAIRAGVDVRGYFAWSFLDNFEWESGYTLRFGITYIDYKNGLTRYMKRSAFWFINFLQKENVIRSKPLLYQDSN